MKTFLAAVAVVAIGSIFAEDANALFRHRAGANAACGVAVSASCTGAAVAQVPPPVPVKVVVQAPAPAPVAVACTGAVAMQTGCTGAMSLRRATWAERRASRRASRACGG